MNDNYEKLFQTLERFEPSRKLFSLVTARIYLAQRRSARIRLIFGGMMAIASFAAIVSSFQYAIREFYQSGFYEYFSFLLSDSGYVLSSWKEFSVSLAESLPLTSITIFLAAVFAFLVSAKLAIKNIRPNYNYKLT
ncbi:MAG: hypothetical protein KGJ58_02540 [Patescibacteria group bacterium]|nr:hypothetical protein [Patescibacteria group bacterium]MDE1988278.1 hypothetical protein [Patescibacteria group bacterium]MDE2218305.1 hypothetical protein [Patescibacteria group bacterium]